MELFTAEKVGEMESNSVKRCRACKEKLELVHTVLTRDELFRLFECKCGERVWQQ